MLTDKDLVLIEYNQKIERLLKAQTQKSLVDFCLEWINIPQLQPVDKSTTIDNYKDPQLSKQTIIERITTHDWPNGLYAVQIAQIETKAFITAKRQKRWNIGRLLKDKGKLKLGLEASSIKTLLYEFLSPLFPCYLYTTHHKQSDLYWMRVEFQAAHEIASINTQSTGFLIFYPQTEFVLMSGNWNAIVEKYICEGLLYVFKADRILTQKMKGDALVYLKHVIKTRQSQGVFAQLRNNQVDSNPLDIRQKAPQGFDEPYVEKGEQEKRIRSVDDTLSKAKYETVMDQFGWDYIAGTTILNLYASLPITSDDDQSLTDTISFTMTMKGNNIPMGIKDMIKKGQIETPALSCLVDIGTTLHETLYITKDGVSPTKPEDQDEEEDLEKQEGTDNEEEDDYGEDNVIKDDSPEIEDVNMKGSED